MILIILLVGILSLGSISAAEDDIDNNLDTITDSEIDVSNDDVSLVETTEDLSGEVSNTEVLDTNLCATETSSNYRETKSSSEDNTPLTTPDSGTIAELQAKIDAAQAGDIITLENNYINEESITLRIDKRLTIEGQGHCIFDAKNLTIHITADNVTLQNITFDGGIYNYNNKGQEYPIFWEANNGLLNNCTFWSYRPKNDVVKMVGDNNTIYYTFFYYCYCPNAVVECVGEKTTIAYTTFNAVSGIEGIAIINGSNPWLWYSNFYNVNTSNYVAQLVDGDNALLEGLYCWRCYPGWGGIVINGDNSSIANSIFEYFYIKSGKGALIVKGDNFLVNTTLFKDNVMTYSGGAIFSYGKNLTIDNSRFIRNTLSYERSQGAAIYACEDLTITNSNFTDNFAASKGGAIYVEGDILVNNSKFKDNYGLEGGAIFEYSSVNIHIENTEFTNNNASYGGGAISANSNIGDIINCTFQDNNANYGGAISTNNSNISNCKFYNNTAISFGGAVMVRNSTITESVFRDNSAKHGNGVVSLEKSDFINTEIDDGDYINYEKTLEIYPTESIAICCEALNGADYRGFIFDGFDIINSRTGENVADKVKIAIYLNLKTFNLTEEKLNNLIYWYTDSEEDYHQQFSEEIAMIDELYESGFRIGNNGTFKLDNGTCIFIGFKSSVHSAPVQNNIIYEVEEVPTPDLSIEKITLTPIVNKGTIAKFTIIVKNLGDVDLEGVYVREVFPEYLKYVSFEDDSERWIYNGTYTWSYNGTLKVRESANFTVLFNTTLVGNFTNLAIAGSSLSNESNSTDNITVVQPKIKITEITANTTLTVGDKTNITLVVENNGDAPLTDIYVEQSNIDGLDYTNYTDESGLWIYDGVSRWTYTGVLEPGESANFTITFVATEPGSPAISFYSGVANEEISSTDNETFDIDEDTIEDDDDDDSDITIGDDDKNRDTDKSNDKNKNNITKKDSPKKYHQSKPVKAGNTKTNATGNPIIALLFSLVFILVSIKGRNK